MPINPNLTRKQVEKFTTEKLLRLMEDAPYRHRGEAIGNNQTIQYVYEELHYERKEINCEDAYCFEECEKNF